jgi:FAD/FMN-containing dehydrogenase
MSIKDDIAAVVGADNVSDAPETLAGYAADESFVAPRSPSLVAFPGSAEEVQAIMKYANETKIPVTPRSSRVGFNGAGIPGQGGIVVDLLRMNKVLRVDPRNKKVKVEAGVTWPEVQAALAEHGMFVCPPMLPHAGKSVVSSVLEREPIVVAKSEYSDQLATSELVLPNGEMFWTGTALGRAMKDQCYPDSFVPGARLWNGAQGTLGITTWANIKAEFKPVKDKVFFIGADSVDELVEPVYHIQRLMLGYECFLMNDFDLAQIAAADYDADFEDLRDALPAWTAVIVLSALDYLPDEKLAYEEDALRQAANDLHFEVTPTVGGVSGLGSRILGLIRGAWDGETYWKQQYKGGSHDVFFHTTLDRVPEFTEAINDVAARYGYPTGDIGIYVQPLDRAHGVRLEFSFSCDPTDAAECAVVARLFLEASEVAIDLGGFFTTPYGPWADMVYSRTASVTSTLKAVKNVYDPNNVLNPGKLCF